RQIESIRLEKPHLRITKDVSHWMPPARVGSEVSPEWLIRKIEILDGRLTFEALGERIPKVTLHVQADLEDLGSVHSKSDRAHMLELSDAVFSFSDSFEQVFAKLDKGVLRFTNRGIFLEHRLEALEVNGGYLELDSRLVSQEPLPTASPAPEQMKASDGGS